MKLSPGSVAAEDALKAAVKRRAFTFHIGAHKWQREFKKGKDTASDHSGHVGNFLNQVFLAAPASCASPAASAALVASAARSLHAPRRNRCAAAVGITAWRSALGFPLTRLGRLRLRST